MQPTPKPHLSNTLLAHCSLAKSAILSSWAKEAKARLHAQEADLALGHVLLDGQVEGQGFQVGLRQDVADVNHLLQGEGQAVKP